MNPSSSCTLSSAAASPAAIPAIGGHSHRQQASSTTFAREAIDRDAVLQRCLNDAVFCGVLLHKFACRSGDQAAALERALAAENRLELAREAHTLQGVAANLSASGLRQAAEQLESAAATADLARCAECLVRVRREIADCAALVPELLCWLAGAADEARSR